MNSPPALWVILPTYNEAAAIRGVVEEWVLVMRKVSSSFVILAIDDGSTDATPLILDGLSFPELRVWHRPNAGHGPSCRLGYQTAANEGAEWVLQIDSDGQCDPCYFASFWEVRHAGPVLFGNRVRRADGISRWLLSRVVSLVVYCRAGRWLKDANVPYRLILASHLRRVLPQLPENAFFTNILLSYLLADEIKWLPIHFRKRAGGNSTIKLGALARLAVRLSQELRSLKAGQ